MIVGVVVPVRARTPEARDDLARCLAALAACDPAPAAIVVCDDGSPAPVGVPPGVAVLRIAPSGPAAARNAGAAALPVACDALVFVDSDVEVPPDAFARLEAAWARWPEAAAVWAGVAAAHPHPGLVSRYKHLSHRAFVRALPTRTRHLTSMCVAIRREAFVSVGGFDTRWDSVSVEDVELGRTLHAAGHVVVRDESLEVVHRHRHTFASALRNDLHKVRRHARTTLARRRAGCPSVRVEDPGEVRQLRYLLGVPLGVAAVATLPLPPVALGCAAALVAWERAFFRALREDGGTAFAVACVPLAAWERVVSAVALGAGVLDHVRDVLRGRSS
ncbi:MAG: hypothetical protein RLZZ299_1870 [Pseudomonadota bacterium]